MLVRIMGEGQYDLPETSRGAFEDLDLLVTTAIDDGDREAFAASFAALIALVRSAGTISDVDALNESEAIVPPADATFDEVAALLGDTSGA
jgi:hypothetical protein